MNPHALAVLEFARVLQLVASRATTEAGKRVLLDLLPMSDIPALEVVHAQVAAMRALVQSDAGWTPHPIPDAGQSLGRLRLVGAALTAAELLDIAVLLRSGRLTRSALGSREYPPAALAVLAPYREHLLCDDAAEAAVDRVIGEDGQVRDSASPLLHRLRRELRGAEGEVIALLERIVQHLDARYRVPDVSITVRNGRYVIPVRREGRVAVGGLVHDTSQSGSTLFVEPPAAVEACNRIRELEAEQLREIDRLLLALTDRVRPLREPLASSAAALAELDALYARARFAADFGCGTVRLVPPGSGFRLLRGRHPLLVDQRIDVVPFDLEMHGNEHTLLVSGPNTGGKTVLLKTVGLLSVMAQSGIPVTVAPESVVVVYDDVFADIGDEQSIEASLSTFSAHMKNIAEILRSATSRSLVLLDELGSGTDPLEGAALGGAVLESLTQRHAQTVATTHLGALKELASEMPGIVNASLQFDAEALAPTYLLIKGIPGRSYGISIARRLQLPDDVLQRAEERVPQVERDVNALLARLEERDAALTETEREVRAAQRDVRDRAHRLAERERNLRHREREFERESRHEARRFLLDARQHVERAIAELRRTAAEASADDAARAARQQVEQMAEEHRLELSRLDGEQASTPAPVPPPLAGEPVVGEYVRVLTLGDRVGRLLERRDDECVVALGDVKMSFPADALVRAGEQGKPAISVPVRGDLPEMHVATEIDVRGMRAAELDEIVLSALDAAIRADLRSLRIIHGKGTGALRERVAEMLRKDTRVRSFRLGAWNEGGAGVTVAEL